MNTDVKASEDTPSPQRRAHLISGMRNILSSFSFNAQTGKLERNLSLPSSIDNYNLMLGVIGIEITMVGKQATLAPRTGDKLPDGISLKRVEASEYSLSINPTLFIELCRPKNWDVNCKHKLPKDDISKWEETLSADRAADVKRR